MGRLIGLGAPPKLWYVLTMLALNSPTDARGFFTMRTALWIIGIGAVATTAAMFFDLSAAAWFRKGPLPGDIEKIFLLAEIFAHGLGVLLIMLTVKTLDHRGWRVVPRIAGTAYIAGLTANCLKVAIVRQRPNQFEQMPQSIPDTFGGFCAPWQLPWDQAFEYGVQSFPSGHTATAFGLAMGLSRLYPRGAMLFFIFAAMAGMQRLVAQAHFPSDVIAGAAVGLAMGILLQRPRSWLERLCVAWESGCIDPVKQQAAPSESLKNAAADDKLEGQGETGRSQSAPDGRRQSDVDVLDYPGDHRCAG